MKKILSLLLVFVIVLAGCSSEESSDSKHIEELNVAFVPSAPAEEIQTATAPLEQMIIDQMADQGYTIDNVNITVGVSYEAVGEGLAGGSIDVGFIPGGTYVLYEDDGVTPILTATRYALNKDSENAADWNDGTPTENTDDQVAYYRSLIIAGPSEYGQELSDKVNSGEDLTWDDYNNANVCVQSTSSSSGYLYPSIYLSNLYGKGITDLENVVSVTGYGDAIGRLASGQCDLAPIYADARMDYGEDWTSTYNREADIFDETNVIGVTDGIYNDTISVSEQSEVVDDEFIDAFQQSMINISETDEGAEVISIYSHIGYEIADPSNYDGERQVQEEFKE